MQRVPQKEREVIKWQKKGDKNRKRQLHNMDWLTPAVYTEPLVRERERDGERDWLVRSIRDWGYK